MARSALSLGTNTALPSGALPVATEMKPPAAMMPSKALRSTTRKALGLHGSRYSSSPSLK